MWSTRDPFREDHAVPATRGSPLVHARDVSLHPLTLRQPTAICAILIADCLSLFATLGPAGSSPKTLAELAAPRSADLGLVKRVLRHLAAKQFVAEHPDDTYQANDVSEMLSNSDNCAGIRQVANRYIPIFAKAPKWLKEHNYQCPSDATDAVFQTALGKKGQTMWDWFQEPPNQEMSDDFNRQMRFTVQGRKSWLDVRPPDDLVKAWDGESPLIVDVGGGIGQDVAAFKRKFPDVQGKIVLQDLPSAIEQARKNADLPGIELLAHDAFKEQPVKGSKIYFMGNVLHDWPDSDAKKILEALKPAMRKGYSTLLLSENVLPEVDCNPHLSAIDICMMTELAALERSDKQWNAVLTSAGFKLVKVFTIPSSTKSVLQAELA